MEFPTADDKIESTREDQYDADGNLESYTITEYDEYGREIKVSVYFADGSLEGYGIVEYNEIGERTRFEFYNADGTLEGVIKFEYYTNGVSRRQSWHDAEGTCYEFEEFNEQGQMVRAGYMDDTGTMVVERYDGHGNMIGYE